MIVLHHAPQSRSVIALWMLEEIGAPYGLHVLNLNKGEQRDPAYLAVNPMGKVPAITHDGVTITEAAAICCYLADAFPNAGLAPPIGDARRGPYLKWLFFAPSCLEPAIIDRMLKRDGGPERALGWGSFDAALGHVEQTIERTPYLCGDAFTAADLVMGAGINWGFMTKLIPEKPALAAYTKRLAERPAFQRMWAKDAELATAQAG
jgi:glutathione S-transferase